MAAVSSPIVVGTFDEAGYLNGMTRRGFTFEKCILELVANSLDACDEIIASPTSFRRALYAIISRDKIKLVDNGVGMNADDCRDMFALYRENIEKRKDKCSRGVSGLGSKPALAVLSKKTNVVIFTKKVGSNYYRITVPWERMYEMGKYSMMVNIETMTDEEKDTFITERREREMLYGTDAQGTTIVFQYNDNLSDVIVQNFENISKSTITNPLDRLDFVFGKDDMQFCLDHYDSKDLKVLPKYNYFHGTEANFYTNRSVDKIKMYTKDDNCRFIWSNANADGDDTEIVPHGKGYRHEPQTVSSNLHGWQYVGEFTVTCGMRVDLDIFNPDRPSEIKADRKYDSYSSKFLCSEDGTYNKFVEEYVMSTKIIRNDQLIGIIPPELVKPGNARANGESRCKIEYVQAELSFEPVSTQNNPMDRAVGTQENKNQLNGSAISKKLIYLLEAIKSKKASQIWNYMKCRIPSEEFNSNNTPNLHSSISHSYSTPPSDLEELSAQPIMLLSSTALDTIRMPSPSAPPVEDESDEEYGGIEPSPSDSLASPNQEQDCQYHTNDVDPSNPSNITYQSDISGLPVETLRVELSRVLNSLDSSAILTDSKWFSLYEALREC